MTAFGGGVTFTDDDNLWVAKAQISEFFAFIVDPVCWVANNVAPVPKKNGGVCGPPAVLPNYSISFEQSIGDEDRGDEIGDADLFWVQGIDQTNIVTVRMPATGANNYINSTLLKQPATTVPPKTIDCPYGRCANPAYMSFLAQELVYNALSGQTASLPTAAAALFHHKLVHLSVCDKLKAYAHMQLDGTSHSNLSPALRSVSINSRVMVALYHIFAAAWPKIVEDSFNGCSSSSKDHIKWKKWQNGKWQDDTKDTIDISKCFSCHDSDPPPMTITGTAPTELVFNRHEGRHPCMDDQGANISVAGSFHLKHLHDAHGRARDFAALLENPEQDLFDDVEATCEMLVAEYNAGQVSWSDAFSKTYTGG